MYHSVTRFVLVRYGLTFNSPPYALPPYRTNVSPVGTYNKEVDT